MTIATSDQDRDAFGAGAGERFGRRLVAAIISASLFGAVFSVFLLSATSVLAVAACFLLMLPLSYAVEGRWPGRTGWQIALRYAVLGAVLGCAVIVVLIQALPRNWVLIAGSGGAVSGGLGAWIATALPVRWIALAGVLAAVVAAGAWLL